MPVHCCMEVWCCAFGVGSTAAYGRAHRPESSSVLLYPWAWKPSTERALSRHTGIYCQIRTPGARPCSSARNSRTLNPMARRRFGQALVWSPHDTDAVEPFSNRRCQRGARRSGLLTHATVALHGRLYKFGHTFNATALAFSMLVASFGWPRTVMTSKILLPFFTVSDPHIVVAWVDGWTLDHVVHTAASPIPEISRIFWYPFFLKSATISLPLSLIGSWEYRAISDTTLAVDAGPLVVNAHLVTSDFPSSPFDIAVSSRFRAASPNTSRAAA